MRISDWSSDVCSSDLRERGLRWPVVNGKETLWRYREGYDPYVKPGEGVRFYGRPDGRAVVLAVPRSEEHTSELQSLMRISYAVFCLKKKTILQYYATLRDTRVYTIPKRQTTHHHPSNTQTDTSK